MKKGIQLLLDSLFLLVEMRLHLAQNTTSHEKRNPAIARFLFLLVGIADEISNIKFIEDFDKIVNFMLSSIHV